VFGGIGTFAAWIIVMVLNFQTLIAGVAWMAIGLTLYVWYRRRQGLSLEKTVKVETLSPLGVEEVEYNSVLVAFEDGEPFSEEAVATASALAARRSRAIHVLSLVNVPTYLSLDAEMRAEESEAQSKIERAKLICGRRVSGQVQRVRPGQEGAAIIKRAKQLKARVIVVQLRYRDGRPLYRRSLQIVLAARPCRVIVVANPSDFRDGRPGSPVPAVVGAPA